MKKDYVLPEKQYGICPKCGLSINSAIEGHPHNKMICDTCGTEWEAKYSYGYEDMIVSAIDLPNKDKKKQKDFIIKKYEQLKLDIESSKKIVDLQSRHNRLSILDDEFRILCSKKYNAYFNMGNYNNEVIFDYYKKYLDSRSFKMIRDINKILFYFGK